MVNVEIFYGIDFLILIIYPCIYYKGSVSAIDQILTKENMEFKKIYFFKMINFT